MFYDATKAYAPAPEVAFYASFIEKNPGRVLEAMSGSGRLQIPLIQRGYIVDGVDNSAIMLDRCRQRCAELNITPELYQQSLEHLSIPHTYATVTIAVGSFQLLVDRAQALQALKNIRAHMQDNGNLLIDIFVPDTDDDGSEALSTRIADIDLHTKIILTTRYTFDTQARRADALCTYELVIDDVVQEKEQELIQVTWYTDEELQQLLQEAGFTTVAFYDETFRASGPSRIIQAQAV
jgi:SAM-dependent methyltransferase